MHFEDGQAQLSIEFIKFGAGAVPAVLLGGKPVSHILSVTVQRIYATDNPDTLMSKVTIIRKGGDPEISRILRSMGVEVEEVR